jgi:hypothetical protein
MKAEYAGSAYPEKKKRVLLARLSHQFAAVKYRSETYSVVKESTHAVGKQ